jgi:hypothetical protein
MKKTDKKLIEFLNNNKGYQWYSNDRSTKKIVNRLVNRNFCIKKQITLDNGYIYRSVKLI